MPIVRKLQADAINQDISVSSLLRTAKVIATKLDLENALVWIDRELDGCLSLPTEELPPYRQLTGDVEGYNPYHGWQAIHFQNPEHARAFSKAPIGISIGAIEEDLKGGRTGHFQFTISPETKSQLVNALEYPADVRLRLGYGAVYNIVDAVRNLVLNWCLELEKAGIVGDDMEFSPDDKREAAPITQQFFAQNIGVVGNVTDQAHVASEQSATMSVDLNLTAVQDLVGQARQALPLLPEDARNRLEPTISDLEKELAEDTPSQSRIRELMLSAQSVCEGAVGNLAAQGVLGLLKYLL